MAAATIPIAGYGNQGPSPSPSKSVTPIARLNPYQNRWTIKARVMVKGDMRCAAMVLFLLVIHAPGVAQRIRSGRHNGGPFSDALTVNSNSF
jgi:hypothetical protein